MSQQNSHVPGGLISRALAGASLAMLLVTGGCVIGFGFPWQEAREVELRRLADVRFEGDGPLRVQTANGRIRVRQVEGPTVVLARLRATTRTRLEESRVLAERRSDGGLEISVEWAGMGRRSNEGCDFDIEVPGATRLVLETSNGTVRLEGIEGAADIETSNGRIDVRDHKGRIRAETSNARVVIDGAGGDVEIETSNGAIEALAVAGAVRARTSNASIEVRLAPGTGGPVDLRSSNGAIDLTIPRAFAGELRMRTSHGRIKVDEIPDAEVICEDRDDARVRIGGGDPVSQIRTSNSSIRVYLDNR